MSILKNEICKLLTKRTIWILFVLTAINLLFQLYIMNTPNEDGYTLKEYSGFYREMSAYSQDGLLGEIEKRETEADTYGEANLYSRVYREVEACITYDEYLSSIDEKAEEITIMNPISVKLSPTFCAYCGKPLKIIGTERFCNNVQCFNRFQNV